MDSDDRPNYYETDFEKLPIMTMTVEILDSMICVDSFEANDLVNFKGNLASFEQ